MAHEIEMTARGASFAYVEEHGKPWHGLGTPVSRGMTPDAIAAAAHIDWELEKVPILQADTLKPIEGFFNLRRATDKKSFDVVTDLYKPLQPLQAIRFFTQFVEAGDMEMETCGSLQDGKRIFATAKLKDGFTLLGGDRVDGYLLFSSPHYKGECALAKFTGVRTVCMNTFRMALNDGLDAVRIHHLTEFDGAAQEAVAQALGLATRATREFQEQAEALSRVPARDEETLRYIIELTGTNARALLTDGAAEREREGKELTAALMAAEEEALKHPSVDDLNRVGKKVLEAVISSPGADLRSARGTWWGVVNGVSYVADHEGSKNLGKRYESAWFGQKAALKREGVTLALEYAGLTK